MTAWIQPWNEPNDNSFIEDGGNQFKVGVDVRGTRLLSQLL